MQITQRWVAQNRRRKTENKRMSERKSAMTRRLHSTLVCAKNVISCNRMQSIASVIAFNSDSCLTSCLFGFSSVQVPARLSIYWLMHLCIPYERENACTINAICNFHTFPIRDFIEFHSPLVLTGCAAQLTIVSTFALKTNPKKEWSGARPSTSDKRSTTHSDVIWLRVCWCELIDAAEHTMRNCVWAILVH